MFWWPIAKSGKVVLALCCTTHGFRASARDVAGTQADLGTEVETQVLVLLPEERTLALKWTHRFRDYCLNNTSHPARVQLIGTSMTIIGTSITIMGTSMTIIGTNITIIGTSMTSIGTSMTMIGANRPLLVLV